MTQKKATENIYLPLSTSQHRRGNRLMRYCELKYQISDDLYGKLFSLSYMKTTRKSERRRMLKWKWIWIKDSFLYYFWWFNWFGGKTLTWALEMVISFPFMYIYIKSMGSDWELFHWVLLKVQNIELRK